MATTKRICLALDLKDEPMLIQQYKEHHQPGQVWPEVIASIKDAGIEEMEIYCTGNRLFMIMEVNERFDPESKAASDADNPQIAAWENLMNTFQKALPWAKPGEKWVPMESIFTLKD